MFNQNYYFHKTPIILIYGLMLMALSSLALPGYAWGVEPVKISKQDTALDLSRTIKIEHSSGDTIQIATAPGGDGIVRRIEVQANQSGKEKYWAVFSIANPTNEQLDRWLVTPHYRLVGSGIWRPDLGNSRIIAITPSEGFALDRISNNVSDIFSITINPGAVITFVAELNTDTLPQIYLWDPNAYKDTLNSYTLYHGIALGIAALLALLLSSLFLIRGTLLYPAAAAFAWAVLSYICVDFHFIDKLFNIPADREPFWRAASEIALAATLSLFLFAYLDLKRWFPKLRHGPIIWAICFVIVCMLMVSHPIFMAGLGRLGLGFITLIGIVLIIYFSLQHYDRAVLLTPTWLLLSLWLILSWLAVEGRLDNDIIQPALSGMLVLIVLSLAFTIMQYAFTRGSFHQGLFSDTERKALAIAGAQDHVWDWDISRDRLSITPDLSLDLGIEAHKINGGLQNWLAFIHNEDRINFQTQLDNILIHKRGKIKQDLRLLGDDNNYLWFHLKVRPVVSPEQEITHCIGTLTNVHEQKLSQERLLKSAIYDNLTGLPNRQLLLDRLNNLISFAQNDPEHCPSLVIVDFDDFHKVNTAYGTLTGDKVLLIMARRMARLLNDNESLGRLAADKFAFLLYGRAYEERLAIFAKKLQKTLAPPAKLYNFSIPLTASIGIINWTKGVPTGQELLANAELAMLYAKRKGGNQIVPYRPGFNNLNLTKNKLKTSLEAALERGEIIISYQAIMDFNHGHIVGFEAIVSWEHPDYGSLSPRDFVTITENSDLILPFNKLLLKNCAKDLMKLQEDYPNKDYFLVVNLPMADNLSQELLSEIKSALLYYPIKPGRLIIGFSESNLMDNPEETASLFGQMRDFGFHIMLDRFGEGQSALGFLLYYNFDMIKLAPKLVQTNNPNEQKMVEAIINFAHNLSIKIIAEAVETVEQANFLQRLNCEYVQRVAAHKPVLITEIDQLLRNHGT